MRPLASLAACAVCAVCAVCLGAGVAHGDPALQTTATPHPGITVQYWLDPQIPVKLHVIRVDLTIQSLGLEATKQSDSGITTSTFASRAAAKVAINGGPFAAATYTPRGLAIGDSDPWSNTADDGVNAVFHFRRVGERTYATIVPPELVVTPQTLPAGTEGAVSGRPLLVRSGVVETQPNCSDPVTIACERAPRSAVGVSGDGNKMWLVAVDGWQNGSVGMTAVELGTFMKARGAAWAMALDGGGASTLVVDGALENHPSDGVERTVANHIAVKEGNLIKGQLVGFICKHDIMGCPADASRHISGAKVTLDTGTFIMTDSSAYYDFGPITARLACVTVSKSGWMTKTQCVQVKDMTKVGQTYNSFAMFEGKDPPDAGVSTDDGGIEPDANPYPYADGGPDAGTGITGPGGGCCDAGRDHPPFLVVGFVAWFLMRRRGTTVRSPT
jgi:hypothetical protein